MNKTLIVALVAMVAFVGCKKSEEGGRIGNDTFRLSVPILPTFVKQGEVQTARVSVDRGEGFNQQVKLEVKVPAGLQVDPSSTVVQLGDKGEVQLKITAAKDAPLGNQKIMIKGTPDKGESTETEFQITVTAP